MKKFTFEVTTIKDKNTRTALREVNANTEHEARRFIVDYYLTKRNAQVVALKLDNVQV